MRQGARFGYWNAVWTLDDEAALLAQMGLVPDGKFECRFERETRMWKPTTPMVMNGFVSISLGRVVAMHLGYTEITKVLAMPEFMAASATSRHVGYITGVRVVLE